jgi:hypothetical protein
LKPKISTDRIVFLLFFSQFSTNSFIFVEFNDKNSNRFDKIGDNKTLSREVKEMKKSAIFFHDGFIQSLQENIQSSESLQNYAKERIHAADYWMKMDYDQVWELMFPPTIKRSWMVHSNGQCPDCGNDVHMYKWVIDAKNKPWKLVCPHCNGAFPKNDFYAYYKSGICEDGIFRYEKADPSLLVNEEDGSRYGVDDGFSYTDEKGDKYWFIATYLVYGQWRQIVLEGVSVLSDAYCITGDLEFARRAIILLDRIADLYPDFDFREQGIMYEDEKTSRGYVSYWAAASTEAQILAVSYDKVFSAIEKDPFILSYLHEKAVKHNLSNRKATVSDIRKNIEERILKDTIANLHKVRTNYPNTEITDIILSLVLDDAESKKKALEILDDIIETGTYVDGIAGEKGGYSSSSPGCLYNLLSLLIQTEEFSMPVLLEKYPRLIDCYKFHIDSWVLNKYYPGHGDGGRLSDPTSRHLLFNDRGTRFSTFSMTRQKFAYELYRCTSDPDFVKILYISNNFSSEGLFEKDFTVTDSKALQKEIDRIIEEQGPDLKGDCVDFKRFRFALLKSGCGKHKRAAFLDYDTGGNHSHQDELNIELYAKGMKFLPDFGYPPVNCGGWSGPNYKWYIIPASHNLVVIDRKEHNRHEQPGKTPFLRYPLFGETFMWLTESPSKAVYAKAPEYAGTKRYERLIALIDLNDEDCYFLDIFRTQGGKEHTKFIRNGFSELTVKGPGLLHTEDIYHPDALMRNYKKAVNPIFGWHADFLCKDLYEVLEPDMKLYLRYTSLNTANAIYTAESKVCKSWETGIPEIAGQEHWIPTVMEMKIGEDDDFQSAFVSTYEPHTGTPSITEITRSPAFDDESNILSDMNVALKIKTDQGFTDYILAKDPEQDGNMNAFSIRTDALFCFVRVYDDNKEPVIKGSKGSIITFKNMIYRFE